MIRTSTAVEDVVLPLHVVDVAVAAVSFPDVAFAIQQQQPFS